MLDIMNKVGDRISVLSKGASKGTTAIPTETTYPWQGTKGLFMGKLDYGVVDHGQGPYMLTYWFKAVSRPVQAAEVVGKGLELVATQKADRWEVKVLNNGKPCPTAEIVWDDKKESAKDLVSIAIPIEPKPLPIKASLSVNEFGKFQGKAYPTKKVWTSIVLPAVGRAPAGADESAYLALQNATMRREALSNAFAFTCKFQATDGKTVGNGTVSIDAAGKVAVTVDGLSEGVARHVQGQVQSLFFHRLNRPFWQGEGKNPLTWAKGENGLLSVNDKMQSFYRLSKNGFTMVQRTFGENILVLEIKSTVETPWGGILSKEFTSTEMRANDGKVNSRLTYHDDFVRFQDEWIPKSRTITGTASDHAITMSVTFSDYQLVP